MDYKSKSFKAQYYYGVQRCILLKQFINKEKGWDTILSASGIARQFLQTIIQNIERKTSEEFAVVTMRNLIKKLQLTYPFLHEIEIKNTTSLKLESNGTLQDWLNTIHPKEVGLALKELTKKIIKSMRKNAAYFFVRETQEKIGKNYDTMLVKTEQKYPELQKSHTGIYG